MEMKRQKWIPLTTSLVFLMGHIRLIWWSLLLVAATAFLTWLGYHEAIGLVDGLVGSFFTEAPAHQGVEGWSMFIGWFVIKYLFLFFSRAAAFYFAFLAAYCLTTPGYVLLSAATEKIYLGQSRQKAGPFKPLVILLDLWEGLKIGVVGLVVTGAALCLNFLPVVGQILALLLYIFYSALMFVDYPASNRHWSLGQKINWLKDNPLASFRLGIIPALISIIPVINIFVNALFFPLFTVHTTLNFVTKGSSAPLATK